MSRFVVCGVGQVGYRITNLLYALGEDVTAITSDIRPAWASEYAEKKVKLVNGDARDPVILKLAGIETAEAVFVVTSNDSVNVEIVLDCKEINPNIRTIARIFDSTLARELEKGIGLDRGLAMSNLAAPTIAALAIDENIIGEFRLDGQSFTVSKAEAGLGILTFSPSPNSGAGYSIKQSTEDKSAKAKPASVDRIGILRFIQGVWKNAPRALRIAAISLTVLTFLSIAVFMIGLNLNFIDSTYFVITTVSTTGFGDITPRTAPNIYKVFACLLMVAGSGLVTVLYSIITDYLVTARIRQWNSVPEVPTQDHVVVVGLGNVGQRVAEELIELGVKVVGIDLSESGGNVSGLNRRLAIVTGDGRDIETLESANMSTARAIVSTTDSDATNLTVVLVAKGLNPATRTISRIFDATFAAKLQEQSTIDAAVSASRIAAPQFVGAGYGEGSVMTFVVGDHMVSLLIEQPTGQALSEIRLDPLGLNRSLFVSVRNIVR